MKSNWFVRDGQLTGVAVLVCVVFGLAIAFGSIGHAENYYVRMIGISIGLSIAALGGYSARAYAIHLRPFGRSPWRIAKETYKVSPEDDPHTEKSDSDDRKL